MQGAERQVRVPQDLLRFQHLPMLVTFQLEASNKYALGLADTFHGLSCVACLLMHARSSMQCLARWLCQRYQGNLHDQSLSD